MCFNVIEMKLFRVKTQKYDEFLNNYKIKGQEKIHYDRTSDRKQDNAQCGFSWSQHLTVNFGKSEIDIYAGRF